MELIENKDVDLGEQRDIITKTVVEIETLLSLYETQQNAMSLEKRQEFGIILQKKYETLTTLFTKWFQQGKHPECNKKRRTDSRRMSNLNNFQTPNESQFETDGVGYDTPEKQYQ
eukprot:UN33643